MIATLQTFLAFAAVAAAFTWLLRSAPSTEQARFLEFHIFVPVTLLIGFAMLGKALHDRWHDGRWRPETEGLACLSGLALAWGHDASIAAIRRASQISGFTDPLWLELGAYRVFSGALIVIAGLFVLRAASRHTVARLWRWPQYLSPAVAGEIPWAAFAVGWMLFVTHQLDALIRLLTWVYLLIR